jgi:homoserine dehydrogenase
VNYAEALGYRIKHLGVARSTAAGIELRVHPTLIPADRLIANVNGVMNAVMVNGDAAGSTLFYGAGAGMEPTASSVIADLVDVVRAMTSDPENRVPHLAFQPDSLSAHPILPIEACESATTCASRPRIIRACWPRWPASCRSAASTSSRSCRRKSRSRRPGADDPADSPRARAAHQRCHHRPGSPAGVVGPVVRIRVEHLN